MGARGVWQGERGARAGWPPIFASMGTFAGDELMAGSSGASPWVVSRAGARSSPAGGRSALMPVTWGAGAASSGLLPPSVSCGAPGMLSSARPAPDRVSMHTGARAAEPWGGALRTEGSLGRSKAGSFGGSISGSLGASGATGAAATHRLQGHSGRAGGAAAAVSARVGRRAGAAHARACRRQGC